MRIETAAAAQIGGEGLVPYANGTITTAADDGRLRTFLDCQWLLNDMDRIVHTCMAKSS